MRSHLKVYLDFEDRAEALSDVEKGRLLLAMVRYATSGEAPSLSGNERFVFPFFKAEIDREIANYDQKVANGNKGGRPAKPKVTEAKPKKTESKPKKTENNLNAQEEDKDKDEDKDEDKDKDEDSTSCAAASATPPESDVFMRLLTVDGKEYPVTFTDISKAKQLYPAVDVEQEIRNMYGWLDGNPRNRKTWDGMKRFINSWLAKEQNRARPAKIAPAKTVPEQQYTQRQYQSKGHQADDWLVALAEASMEAAK